MSYGTAPRVRARRAAAQQSDASHEWRLQQSFSSVTNDPARPKSISEIIRDIVDGEDDTPVAEGESVMVAQVTDFEPYLDSFASAWEVYARSHRAGRCAAQLADPADAEGLDVSYARSVVPSEYFQADFELGQSMYFEDLRRTVHLQEKYSRELTGYLDAVEASLFGSIQAAQEGRVFDSMVSSSEPLCQDISEALCVVKSLRSRLKSAQDAHLESGVAAARLARRKARVAEVLQLLDGFARMEHLEKSVDALVQDRDYTAALRLLESGSVALEQELGVFTNLELWCSRLARLGRSVALSVQAEFVQRSAEAVLGDGALPAGGSAAPAEEPAEGPSAERPQGMLQMLCWCLAQRRELRSVLGSALRDKLLFELKKRLRLQVQRILDDLYSAAVSHEASPDMEWASGTAAPEEGDLEVAADGDVADAAMNAEEPASAKLDTGETLVEQDSQSPKVAYMDPFPAARKGKTGPKKFLQKVKKTFKGAPSKTASMDAAAPAAEALAAAPPPAERDGAGAPSPAGSTCTVGGPATPQAAAGAAPAVSDITSSVSELSVEGFGLFWERTLQFAVEIAIRFLRFADCIHSVTQSLAEFDSTPADTGKSYREQDVSCELLQLGHDISDALLQKVSVFLQARQSRHQSLSVSQWRQLVSRTAEVLDDIRALQRKWSEQLGLETSPISRNLGAGLLAIIGTQTKPIVQAFHQQSLAEVQVCLESERWERVDVTRSHSQMLAEIVGTCIKQPNAQSEACGDEAGGQEVQEPERCLHLRGLRFLVVPAMLSLMEMLVEYVRLCRDWGSCGPQIVWCVAQLLRHFNQQAHKLVLGGQAVHAQVLRKINATHLALCSQCCTLMEALVPGMQEFLLQILQDGCSSAGSSIMEPIGDLSKVVAEYAAHRAEIFDKLTGILRERYDHHAKRWLGSAHPEMSVDLCPGNDAEAQPPVHLHPHGAIEGLIKDITAMYTVLSKSLSMESVQKIFGKAFAEMAWSFEECLGNGLAAPSPPYEGAVGRSLGDRLAMDIAFLHDQLGRLVGISTPLQNLLADLIYHIRARLPMEDPLRQLHPAALEVLQQSGRLPH